MNDPDFHEPLISGTIGLLGGLLGGLFLRRKNNAEATKAEAEADVLLSSEVRSWAEELRAELTACKAEIATLAEDLKQERILRRTLENRCARLEEENLTLKDQLASSSPNPMLQIKGQLEDLATDPERHAVVYHAQVLGFDFRVPIEAGVWTQILPSVYMQYIGDLDGCSEFYLKTIGGIRFPEHCHPNHAEDIRVEQGEMFDDTGRRWGPGEEWSIPAGEVHSATLRNILARVRLSPPCLSTDLEDIQLDGLEQVTSAV